MTVQQNQQETTRTESETTPVVTDNATNEANMEQVLNQSEAANQASSAQTDEDLLSAQLFRAVRRVIDQSEQDIKAWTEEIEKQDSFIEKAEALKAELQEKIDAVRKASEEQVRDAMVELQDKLGLQLPTPRATPATPKTPAIRGRGRPRIHPVATPKTPATRGRGRPRKELTGAEKTVRQHVTEFTMKHGQWTNSEFREYLNKFGDYKNPGVEIGRMTKEGLLKSVDKGVYAAGKKMKVAV